MTPTTPLGGAVTGLLCALVVALAVVAVVRLSARREARAARRAHVADGGAPTTDASSDVASAEMLPLGPPTDAAA